LLISCGTCCRTAGGLEGSRREAHAPPPCRAAALVTHPSPSAMPFGLAALPSTPQRGARAAAGPSSTLHYSLHSLGTEACVLVAEAATDPPMPCSTYDSALTTIATPGGPSSHITHRYELYVTRSLMYVRSLLPVALTLWLSGWLVQGRKARVFSGRFSVMTTVFASRSSTYPPTPNRLFAPLQLTLYFPTNA
jgi:hypothetical protein